MRKWPGAHQYSAPATSRAAHRELSRIMRAKYASSAPALAVIVFGLSCRHSTSASFRQRNNYKRIVIAEIKKAVHTRHREHLYSYCSNKQ